MIDAEHDHVECDGMPEFPHVTRVVVVSRFGTVEQFYGVTAELSLQDDGQTLKLFMRDHPTVSANDVHASIRAGLNLYLEESDQPR